MPQATEEDRLLWGGEQGVGEDKAIGYLQARGWGLCGPPSHYDRHDDEVHHRNWAYCWAPPTLGYVPDKNELGAICFLIDEWDFGGIVRGGLSET